MNLAHLLAPFVRYLLITFATWLTTTGILDQATADELAGNEALYQAILGVLIYILTLAWYLVSPARKALKGAIDG